MATEPSNGNGYRGTIVVDSGVLERLTSPISKNYMPKGPEHPRYLSMLEFLADKGYRILIPEMVAIEAGRVLGNGINIQERITGHSHPAEPIRVISKLLEDAALHDGDPRKCHPNIKVVKETGPGRIDVYARRIAETLGGYDAATRVGTMLQESKQQGYGDEAICSLLDRLIAKGTPDLFAMTDDTDLTKKVESRGVGNTSALEFVYGYASAGLTRMHGFTNTATPAALTRDYEQNYRDMHHQTRKGRGPSLHPHWVAKVRNEPLVKSLFHLAKDLGVYTPHPHDTNRGRAERFGCVDLEARVR